jgi:uncharacterized protein (TIGR03437 family)
MTRRPRFSLLVWVALSSVPASAFIRSLASNGTPIFRTDASGIQVLVNVSVQAGAMNADGKVNITASSNPMQAVANAGATWNQVGTAAITFLPPQSTTLLNDPTDGKYVVTIQDTVSNRSVVGPALAVTLIEWSEPGGNILDSDIILNPSVIVNGQLMPFSTDHTPNTFDLQSLLTHEMGHSLGADHSPVISATMFFAQPMCGQTFAECTLHEMPSADDIAFATDAYPSSSASTLGQIQGSVLFSNGTAVPGAVVIAVDPVKGTTLGLVANLSDGSFTMRRVPPGSYEVYAQPLNGPTTYVNLSLTGIQGANTKFRTTFAGGNAAPSTIGVSAGGTSSANISVDPANTALQIQVFGVGPASGSGGSYVSALPKVTTSGGAVDLMIGGQGIAFGQVSASQIRILGSGATVRTPSLRADSATVTLNVNGTNVSITPLRFTVDLAAVTTPMPITVMVINGTDGAAWTGGLVLQPGIPSTAPLITEVDNAFSNVPNSPIQSGTWVAIKGLNLSNTSPGRGWNVTENFPLSMDGTSVTINNKPAFVYYISPTQVNVQAPTDAAVGPVSVVIANNGASSVPFTATYQTSSPALLQWGGGQYPYALISRGSDYIGKPSVIAGTVSAHPGDALTLWVTGLGPTNPPIPAGQQPTTFPPLATMPTVTVNGGNIQVLGAVLRFAGLYQVNIQLPPVLPLGDLPIQISEGGVPSPGGILINVQ